MAVVAVGLPRALTDLNDGDAFEDIVDPDRFDMGMTPKDIGFILIITIASAFALATLWFAAMIHYPGPMIHMSYFASAGMMMLAAAYFAYLRVWIAAGIWWIRGRIPFATVMLKTVCRIIIRFNGTIVASFLGLAFSALFCMFWFMSVLGGNQWAAEKGLALGARITIGVFCLIFLYWTNEIARNVVHVTVSGTFATFYFTGVQTPDADDVAVPVTFPTARSAGRALTTSFGSICFGSLLIAIIETLRTLSRAAQQDAADNGNILLCVVFACLSCLLTCIEDLFSYFNK
ncbi:putative choline transporter, neither null mutation nor overexpression affects choline transport, partial [Cladochytrium tenue]